MPDHIAYTTSWNAISNTGIEGSTDYPVGCDSRIDVQSRKREFQVEKSHWQRLHGGVSFRTMWVCWVSHSDNATAGLSGMREPYGRYQGGRYEDSVR